MLPCLTRGDQAASRGAYAVAYTHYVSAVALSPSAPGHMERLCHVTSLLGRTVETRECVARAVALRPDAAFFHALLGELEGSPGGGGADHAAAAYMRARQIEPHNAEHAQNHAA